VKRPVQRLVAGGALASLAVAALVAHAQAVDPRKPSTFVVGAPGGAAPMQRIDGHRSGESKQALPSGTLRVAWRRSIGLGIDQPALAAADGTVAVVTSRGDVVFLDADGEEAAHVGVDGRSAGPAAMTSDGTVVFATSVGDAVGVRRTSARPRFVTRIGGERNVHAAPLSLDDGGVVLATATDLVVLDSEGGVRSRVTLPERPASALLASGDKVLAVTTTGAVYGWTPGREPVLLGSFGAPIDGGAALADPNTLVAVIEGNHLVELDLTRGARSTRSIAQQGLYLGPAAVRRAPTGTLATVLAMTPSRVYVATIDRAGQESQRAPIATLTPQVLADGGVPPLVAPSHTGPLVDARGGVAFASVDGRVGVVSPEGAVELLADAPCPRTGRNGGVAGLTPVSRGAFVVACEGGAVVMVVGPEADSIRRSQPSPARPHTPVPPPSAAPASDPDED
jgi:outer membrane protein assembly factor BamB